MIRAVVVGNKTRHSAVQARSEPRVRIRSEIDGIRSETFTESHFLYDHGYENCLKVQKYLDYAYSSYLRKRYKRKMLLGYEFYKTFGSGHKLFKTRNRSQGGVVPIGSLLNLKGRGCDGLNLDLAKT